MSRGLTLGKFAPLHRGHQHLIETALAECDYVTVLVYDCPETTDVPLSLRADWIRRLYPRARVVEAWNGPTEVGDSPQVKERHERYILDTLKISGITHFYSSEFYGEHVSRALGATDRRVDPNRARHPVSGSGIRLDVFGNRQWLDPIVYRDLIQNVAILGGPSTGKTTLAAHMARRLGTAWMPEYGREYWFAHQCDHRLTGEELVELAEGHLEREESRLLEADRWLFTDTSALTTYVYAQYYHGRALPRLAELALRSQARYDLVLLCAPDFPFEDSWDRSGRGSREELQKRTEAELLRRKVPFMILEGPLEARAETVLSILQRFPKYRNLGKAVMEQTGTDGLGPGRGESCPIF